MSALHNRIVELAQNRTPPASIARMVGTTRDKVYSEIRKARTSGIEIPYFKPIRMDGPAPTNAVDIPNNLHALVCDFAERNGLTRTEATAALLESALLGIGRNYV